MGKLTISMVIFHSFLLVYQKVIDIDPSPMFHVWHVETSRPHISRLHSTQSFDSSSPRRRCSRQSPVALSKSGVNVNQWCWCLCRAKSWLRFTRSFCTMPEWGRMHVEAQWFLYWLGSVPNGFKAASSEKRCATHPASPWLISDTAQRTAGARHHGQGCNTLVHLCSNRSLCCVVYCPKFASLSERACIAGSDTDSRCNNYEVFAPSPRKPWTLDIWQWV